MTVFQYLQSLPQSLFEATLLGFMGFPLDPEKEAWFHEWMNKPYEEVFPQTNLSAATGDITVPLDHMAVLLGKTAETLPTEKQEQLKQAMRDYCEVCDYINNQLVSQQRERQCSDYR